MKVLACSSSPTTPTPTTKKVRHVARIPRHIGRREMVLDSVSLRSDSNHSSSSNARMDNEKTCEGRDIVRRRMFVSTRRNVLGWSAFSLLWHSRYFSAFALGDPSFKIEDVTPQILPFGPLFPSEERVVHLFETNTYSVVNIFDVTLRPQLNVTGVVEIPEGNGSGIVWDHLGHIVTNYHVVGNALSKNPKPGDVVARVNILASEGVQKNFEGKLVGADRFKDLAVLKVEAPMDILRPIKPSISSSLKVGQQCLAIGNPFGFDHTLTVGVISGLNRDIFSQAGVTIGGGIQTDAAINPGNRPIKATISSSLKVGQQCLAIGNPFGFDHTLTVGVISGLNRDIFSQAGVTIGGRMQMDAVINPGNSGGPLLDSKGNMIGINTAIFTQTGTSAGVGFAIPSSTVLKIIPQLIQFGRVVRAGLNVEIAPDLIANQLNVRNGALVLQVPANSLAAKAGIIPTTRGFAGKIILGDIIISVDNKPIRGKSDLIKTLGDYNVGDSVHLKVRRGSQDLEVNLVLEEANN